MSTGGDVAFSSQELGRGGRLAAATGTAAESVAGELAGIAIEAAVFGRLAAAGELGVGLSAFRDGHAELTRQVQAAHADLAQRSAASAADGDRMVRDTTARAAAVPTAAAAP